MAPVKPAVLLASCVLRSLSNFHYRYQRLTLKSQSTPITVIKKTVTIAMSVKMARGRGDRGWIVRSSVIHLR